MNELLEVFGAGFRIGDAKTSYAGGNRSSSFRILINNVAVDLEAEMLERDRKAMEKAGANMLF